MSKWQIMRLYIQKVWFDVKSEWHCVKLMSVISTISSVSRITFFHVKFDKNSLIFTLWILYLEPALFDDCWPKNKLSNSCLYILFSYSRPLIVAFKVWFSSFNFWTSEDCIVGSKLWKKSKKSHFLEISTL